MWSTPFRYLHHLVTVPVRAGDIETRFIFDSGIGTTLVSESLAAAARCDRTGSTFSGRRMSGQEVNLPLGVLGSLKLGGFVREGVDVGIFDMSEMAGLDGIDGFLSLDYFRAAPVTLDYAGASVVIEEVDSLAVRDEVGTSVEVAIELDGPSACVYLPLELPGGDPISAEVDMGSDCLILDAGWAARVGVDLDADSVRKVEGFDETGNPYTRWFTSIEGAINPIGAESMRQENPDVMFQDIIHEGLLGDAFLRNFVVTFDLPGGRMIFGPPAR
jgi:hypothetical protein